jgi:hypothetical protein
VDIPNSYSQLETDTINVDMAAPTGGWTGEARLRIQSEDSLTNTNWQVKFNGVVLSSTSDVFEPFDGILSGYLPEPYNYKAWIVPLNLLQNGQNQVEIKCLSTGGLSSIIICWFDVIVE